MKKIIIASMLSLFSAAVILPVIGSGDALAAGKKKTKTEKPLQKKPAGRM